MATEYEAQLEKLNSEQRKAVEHIEGPVLVVAGPGTGKTQLLTTRAAYILRNTQIEASNILCLTFTETAAFNMKLRLVDTIGESGYKVTTSTYHSFGSDLLERFPEYFARITATKPIDEVRQYAVVEGIVSDLDYDNPLKKSAYYIKDVLAVISELKNALVSPDDLREICTANARFESNIQAFIAHNLDQVVRMSPKHIAAFQNLADARVRFASEIKDARVKSIARLFFDSLDVALQETTDRNTKPLTAWKNNWLARGRSGQFEFSRQKVNEKLIALADIYEAYSKELLANNYHDYNDMILFAIAGLEQNQDFRFSLQEQYQYIMLDEFQDTNAAQMKLITLLTDNPIYEKKPNILAVGDDDQAIYAFQGADYSNINLFYSLFDDVETIRLRKNYRSHEHILQSAETIAQQIESRLPLKSGGSLLAEASVPSAEIQRYEFKSDVAQYAWVTKHITKLIASGLQPKEIAVIAPKHQILEPLVSYLKKASVPVYYEKRENILDDVYIEQVITMSRLALALNAHDKTTLNQLWAQVLSYDFWGIDTQVLWSISERSYQTKRSWNDILRYESQTIQTIQTFFTKLALISKTESLEVMLDYITGVQDILIEKQPKRRFTSPFYNHHFSDISSRSTTPTFWELLSNLTVLRQHMRDRQTNETHVLKLDDFIEFVDMHEKAQVKILNTSPYNQQDDSVQLMTAYGAKGLEFNTVFMLATIDEVWGPRATSKSNNIPLPENLRHIRYDGATDDERLRLIYVAMTRAKQRLYMVSYQQNYAKKPTSRVRYFNEYEEADTVKSSVLIGRKNSIIREDYEPPRVDDLRPYWSTRHLEGLQNAKLTGLLRPKLDQYQIAPTHINTFTDIINNGPEYFFLNTILRFPSAATPDGSYGNAFHETMQWIHSVLVETRALPSTKKVQTHFKDCLGQKPLGDKDYTKLLKRGERAVADYYKRAKSEFNASDLHEFDFKRQGVVLGTARITGKIDKLIVNKKNRTITIVDYKTGKSYASWNSAELKLHKYKQQLYFYKLLVEGSYQFADYKVTGAYLDFVEATSPESQKLHISFEADSQQRLAKLIMSIWTHIQTLTFPNTDAYQRTLAGVRAFEDYLIETDKAR